MTVRSKAPKGGRAAIGVRAHSGWAAVIVLAGSAADPVIVGRRRIELRKPGDENARFPFHHVETWMLDRARAFIQNSKTSSTGYALAALSDIVAELKARKLTLAGCSLLTASGRPLPDLAGILASHSTIHAAEGEFFRDAIADACAKNKIAVSRVKEREAMTWAATRLRIGDAPLKLKIDALGKPLGPPWTADQKLATAAALLVLAG